MILHIQRTFYVYELKQVTWKGWILKCRNKYLCEYSSILSILFIKTSSLCSCQAQRHREPPHLQVLRWSNTSCFFHFLRPVLGETTFLVLVQAPAESKVGDPVSEYCSRLEFLGTFCWGLQVLSPVLPLIQGRGRRSFLLQLFWRKDGWLLQVVFRNPHEGIC